MSQSPEYSPVEISFRKGQISAKDPSQIPLQAFEELTNFILDKKNTPTKCEGILAYNSEIGTDVPVKGSVSFVGEDNIEYNIVAVNNKLYWTNGNGVYTAVQFPTATAEDVVIDTANYDYEFLVMPRVISGTQAWVIYVVTDDYPICNNTKTTGGARDHADLARGLRLQISGGVIIAKLIYYDSAGSLTAGADELEVGSGAGETGFPKQAKIAVSIFDRGVYFNFSEGKNNWIATESRDAEDLTPASGSNLGGGTQPEEFTAAIVKGSEIIAFTRNRVLSILASASALVNWREVWINTSYGCVSKRSVCLHTDGWIYYLSDKGICRTDGRVCEKVDYDIEDKIKLLPQLSINKFSHELSSSSDFDAGTPSNGDNLLVTTGATLTQKNLTTETIDSTTIVNGSFESDLTNWTQVGSYFSIVTSTYGLGPQSGSKFLSMNGSGASSLEIRILNASDTVIATYGFGGYGLTAHTGWQRYIINPADIVSLIGTNIKIQVYVSGSATVTSDAFAYSGKYISFYIDRYYNSFSFDNFTMFASTHQSIDFGVTPTSLGNVSINATIPTGASIVVKIATSADNITFSAYATLGTISASGNSTISLSGITPARYLRYSIEYLEGDIAPSSMPSVINIYTGAQWVSAIKNIGYVPSAWGLFDCDFSLLGQTITFEMDTSTSATFATSDGYVAVTSGAIPSNTLRQYIRFRVTLNTTDYTQLPLVDRLTQYWFKNAATNVMPCMFSDGDRIYLGVQSPSGTTNDHVWLGQTRNELEATSNSRRTGIAYPEWSKIDFMKANVFTRYKSILCFGDAVEGKLQQITGLTNNGSAFTSTLITASISFKDVESVFRECFLYSKSDQVFSLYVRTRRGVNNWSAWSTAKTIALAPLISRSALTVLAGLVAGDFAQFKIETTLTDDALELSGMVVFVKNKAKR